MGRAAWQRRKTALLIGVAVLASGLGVLAYATHLLRRTELQTIDARFSIRGSERPPSDIVLVSIDSSTLTELRKHGMYSEFPFPRRYDATVIDRLREAGAKVIAMDIQFTQPTDNADDEALAAAIEGAHGKVVLATSEVAANGETRVFGGNKVVEQLGARVASAAETVDTDGEIRRFAYARNGLESFPVVTAELASGRPVKASLFSAGPLPIDYVGPPRTFHGDSFYDVLTGKPDPGLFAGKVVIVGASAPILQDVHATATTNGSEMSGPEIWANATSTLLRGAPLRDIPGWLNVLLIVLLGSIASLGSLRLRPSRAMLDLLAAAVAFTVATQVAFDDGRIVDFVYPLFALAVGTLGTLAVLYLITAIERERVHHLFSRFVPADVVAEVVARTDDNLRLGAVERDCTGLFCDLRGFTTFSESQSAARVIEVVNYYLNEMTEAILDAGGTLISYMGDGIMALFGAPLEQDDHADRAVAAAREMIGPRLDRFNAWLREQGFHRSFEMGVGLNSGALMAGNVGSEQRVEYTAIGDTTNTASRLEGMTKDSDAMLFISATTHERLRTEVDDLIPVGEVEIRGRTGKLTVWTIGPPGAGAPRANERPGSDERPGMDELPGSEDRPPSDEQPDGSGEQPAHAGGDR
jgi:adenylate cyclase